LIVKHIACTASVILLTTASTVFSQSFQGLGIVSGTTSSSAVFISDNGSTVIGSSDNRGVFWNRTASGAYETAQLLDPLSGGGVDTRALNISPNGSVIVGDGDFNDALFWDQNTSGGYGPAQGLNVLSGFTSA